MSVPTHRPRRLLLAGLVLAALAGVAVTNAVAAEAGHPDDGAVAAAQASAPPSSEGPLPGGDSTFPAAAAALLLTSAGLALVVRRSPPLPVEPIVIDVEWLDSWTERVYATATPVSFRRSRAVTATDPGPTATAA